ncbi:MAG: hypothetical protein ABI550_06160 [Ignavibacteriaceae bacterium]
MLDKIINITAGSDFKKSKGFGSNNKPLKKNPYNSFQFHDSIIFSPALQFLTKVEWKLKEIKHLTNGSIAISFTAAEIEFQTIIDIPNISNLKTLDYKVIKEEIIEEQKNKLLIEIQVKVEESLPGVIHFTSLEKLFKRLFILKIENQLTRDNSGVLNNLIEDLMTDLKKEFNIVNNHLFTFLEKLTESKH